MYNMMWSLMFKTHGQSKALVSIFVTARRQIWGPGLICRSPPATRLPDISS